jgi:hypothetical protein
MLHLFGLKQQKIDQRSKRKSAAAYGGGELLFRTDERAPHDGGHTFERWPLVAWDRSAAVRRHAVVCPLDWLGGADAVSRLGIVNRGVVC